MHVMNITEFVVVIIHGSYFNAFSSKSNERRDQLFICLKYSWINGLLSSLQDILSALFYLLILYTLGSERQSQILLIKCYPRCFSYNLLAPRDCRTLCWLHFLR